MKEMRDEERKRKSLKAWKERGKGKVESETRGQGSVWKEEIREIDRKRKRREEEKRSMKRTLKRGEKVEGRGKKA